MLEIFLHNLMAYRIQKKTKIKKLFIEGIKKEIEDKFLQRKFQIIQKDGSIKNINELIPINITKIDFIYFYENVALHDIDLHPAHFD